MLSIIVVLSLSVLGCGKEPSAPTSSQVQSQNAPTPLPSELPNDTDPSPSPSPSPTPTNRIQVVPVVTLGVQTFQTQAETGNILKLTVKPKPSYNSDYGCVSFQVEIGGTVFHTGILRVEEIDSGNCPGAPTGSDIDYASYLASGSNTLDIKLKVEQTDRSCYLMGFRCPSWMPQSSDQTHSEISIETNAVE